MVIAYEIIIVFTTWYNIRGVAGVGLTEYDNIGIL